MTQPRERMRKHKFTDAELDVLIEEVTQREDVLFGLQGNRLTTREKYKIWFDITERVCATSGIQRSINEVKRRWQDLKRRTKAKVIEARRHMPRNSPSSSLYLTSMEQRVYDSLNIHTVVKDEEQDSTLSSLPEDSFLVTVMDTASRENCQQPADLQQVTTKAHHREESSATPVVQIQHTYTEPTPIPFSNSDINIVNQVRSRYAFRSKVEAIASEGSPTRETAQGSYPALRGHLKAWSGTSCNKTVPLGSFEQQLLRAHREHTAALKDGFRTLTRQNRLIYREMCETNKNIARIASCLAEKNESVSDLAEELVGIHHKITESIDATNCLQDRVIDLLASQQERSVFVVPSAVKAPVPTSSIVEQENTARKADKKD
ncbi:myb-related transcription factor, partner of profilin-like [Lepisosteus oculatus]|uniref:myb-related transcription factor, partner of profilin-like n=1 Tax=Lepisosteus oculatus TaxID=7918 RepID=UPI00372203FF